MSSPYGARILGRSDQSVRALRIRVQLLLTLFLTGTNVVGAVLVFVIANFVIPGPSISRGLVVALAIAVPVYVVVAIVVGTCWARPRPCTRCAGPPTDGRPMTTTGVPPCACRCG